MLCAIDSASNNISINMSFNCLSDMQGNYIQWINITGHLLAHELLWCLYIRERNLEEYRNF